MPPKTRPRAGRRAAGTRNVATGSQEAPIEIAAETSSVISSEAASAVVSSQPAQAAPSEAVSPATTATTGPSEQQTDGLKDSPAPSTSQSTRGKASTRGRKPVIRQPAGRGRRNKEQREALEREALEKERARKAELDAEERKQNRGNFRGGSRARGGRGRGGFLGFSDSGGIFSTGRYDKTAARKAAAAPSGSRAVVVKTEPNMGGDNENYRASYGSGIKREGGGYVSSEDEDEADLSLPKQDIDMIDLTKQGSESPERQEKKPVIDPKQGSLPVRINRKEHQERVVGINTEASSSSTGKLKQEPGKDADASTQKGKAKAKELEITEVRQRYKGVWQDSSEDDVNIKPEPMEDGDELNMVPPTTENPEASSSTKASQKSPSVEKKHKKQTSRGIVQKPALQTEEEKEEWERYERSLQDMKFALGSKPRPLKAQVADEQGDAVMKDDEAADDIENDPARLRDEFVYLFQLPPILPDLLPPETDNEPTAKENTPAVEVNNGEETVIKLEEGDSAAPEPPRTGPRLASGRIGKMRVHASGRTTLDWGGMIFEVKRGLQAQFLQETVCTRITPEKDRVNEDDGGMAYSFGTVGGKFVVTPDWSELLG